MDDDTRIPGIDPEPPELTAPDEGWKPSWRTWVAVGAGAALFGAAAVFGLSAATSSDSPNAVATSETPAAGSTDDSGALSPPGSAGQSPAGGPEFAGRLGGFGTIASIDGSNLTIEDPSGTTTKVVTSSATTVTTSENGSVDDIKVGDTVMVVGTGSETEIAATRVTDDGAVPADADADGPPDGSMRRGGPPGAAGEAPTGESPAGRGPAGQGPGGEMPGADGMLGTRGVVASVGDGTFTVTGLDGTTVMVTTSDATEVRVARAATLADLEVGDTVMVRGTEADGTITATSIREGAMGGPPPGGRPDAAAGTEVRP